MESREYYIRYRIYVNYAPKSGKNYPRRLYKNLYNLHRNLQNTNGPTSMGITIKSKTFIPKNYKHVNPKYYNYIAHMSSYFNCLAVWDKVMVKGTIETINTFTIYGYEPDILLANHYITKVINNLEAMRFNVTQGYRRLRINRRRRGTNKYEKETATEKSSKFFYKSLYKLCLVSKEILDNKGKDPYEDLKIQNIFKYLVNKRVIDFKAYNYKVGPKINNGKSRGDKFQNKRFIIVNF